jgi:DNA-binding transcriptional LysR family regulator
VSGTLKLSAPPSISNTLLTPLVTAFQASYPNVRIQILVTERMVDLIAKGVDLAFRLGALKDSCLVARRILSYRPPACREFVVPEDVQAAENAARPAQPSTADVFALAAGESWTFIHAGGRDKETMTFEPHLSMNDYDGLAPALLAAAGSAISPRSSSPLSSTKAGLSR